MSNLSNEKVFPHLLAMYALSEIYPIVNCFAKLAKINSVATFYWGIINCNQQDQNVFYRMSEMCNLFNEKVLHHLLAMYALSEIYPIVNCFAKLAKINSVATI